MKDILVSPFSRSLSPPPFSSQSLSLTLYHFQNSTHTYTPILTQSPTNWASYLHTLRQTCMYIPFACTWTSTHSIHTSSLLLYDWLKIPLWCNPTLFSVCWLDDMNLISMFEFSLGCCFSTQSVWLLSVSSMVQLWCYRYQLWAVELIGLGGAPKKNIFLEVKKPHKY